MNFVVNALYWQTSETFVGKEIKCIACYSSDSNSIWFKQDFTTLEHPFFKKKEQYELFILNISSQLDNHLIVKTPDGNEHSIAIPWIINNNTFINSTKFLHFKGFTNKGELLFNHFISFEQIVKYRGFKRLTLDAFRSEDDTAKLIQDYDNKENLWILTFCNVLEIKINESIKNIKYEFALIYTEILIEFEDWILNSGFLNSFRGEKKENTILVTKEKLANFNALKKVLQIKLDNNEKEYIKEQINLIYQDTEIDFVSVEKLIFHSCFDNTLDINDIINLCKSLGRKHIFITENLKIYLFYLEKRVSDLIYKFSNQVFIDNQKREKYYQQNGDIKEVIRIIPICLLLYKELNQIDKLNLNFIRFLRFVSMLREGEVLLINQALSLSLDNFVVSKLILEYLNWDSVDNFDEIILETISKYNIPHKSKITNNNIEIGQEINVEVTNINRYGINVLVNNRLGVLSNSKLSNKDAFVDNVIKQDRNIGVKISLIDDEFDRLLVTYNPKTIKKPINQGNYSG